MKNFSKTFAVSAVALATLALNSVAFADDATTTVTTPPATTVQTAAPVQQSIFLRMVKVTAINGNSITATDATGGTFNIDATSAQIIRKYGAASSMLEMSVGDMLRVYGTYSPIIVGGTVTATHIRNYSVHKYLSIVTGSIATITSTGFTLTSYGQPGYTITVNSSTQYKTNTNNTVNGLSDLMVGDSVRTYGLIDTAVKTEIASAVRLLGRTTAAPATTTTTTSS